jgi:hypothetical protein
MSADHGCRPHHHLPLTTRRLPWNRCSFSASLSAEPATGSTAPASGQARAWATTRAVPTHAADAADVEPPCRRPDRHARVKSHRRIRSAPDRQGDPHSPRRTPPASGRPAGRPLAGVFFSHWGKTLERPRDAAVACTGCAATPGAAGVALALRVRVSRIKPREGFSQKTPCRAPPRFAQSARWPCSCDTHAANAAIPVGPVSVTDHPPTGEPSPLGRGPAPGWT